MTPALNPLHKVHRQLRNNRPVIHLNLLLDTHIATRDEVDTDTLASPASRTTDTVEINMDILRHIEINHRAYLLNINTARSHIG